MACGYNHTFVGEVPNDLICVICTFVVLDPVQISSCGHRFCSACFTEFKQSNNQRSLKCPTDQKVIEVNKVFSDQAAKRTVLNFHVQCSTSDCRWVGSLKEFEEQHSATCKSKIQDDKDNVLVKHFTEKIDKLEDRIVELEREQISLRNKIFVMKNDDTVSRALAELRNQMATQKNTFEKQIEGLTRKGLPVPLPPPAVQKRLNSLPRISSKVSQRAVKKRSYSSPRISSTVSQPADQEQAIFPSRRSRFTSSQPADQEQTTFTQRGRGSRASPPGVQEQAIFTSQRCRSTASQPADQEQAIFTSQRSRFTPSQRSRFTSWF